MNLFADVSIFAIKAPIFVWGASFFIALLTVIFLLILLFNYFKIRSQILNAQLYFNQLYTNNPRANRNGWALSIIDEIQKTLSENPLLNRPWQHFEGHFIRIEREGNEVLFSGSNVSESFSYDNVIGPILNTNWWSAVPSILTALGLLCTFIAILIALMGVQVDPNTQQVSGIQGLINGLSGKFVSSISALICAIAFIAFEKCLFYRIEKKLVYLNSEIEKNFPTQTSAKILSRMELHLSEQSLAFRQFNTDLTNRLKESFSESMGPTLNNMVMAINKLQDSQNQLNSHLSTITQGNQELIASRIEGLVQKLETSFVDSFKTLALELRKSFSESTRGHFDSLSDELAKTITLLQGMNTRSETSQREIDKLIEQLKDSAGSTLGKVANTLESSLQAFENSTKNLMEQMAQGFGTLVEKSAGQSNSVLVKANETIEQVTKATSGMGDAWSALEGSAETLKNTATSMSPLLLSIKESTQNWLGIQRELKEVAASMQKAQEAQEQSVAGLEKQIGTLTQGISRATDLSKFYEEIFTRYHNTVQDFSKVFGSLDQQLGSILKQITSDMETYQRTLHGGLEKIADTGDNYLSSISKNIRTTIEELNESLNDFQEILEKTGNGHRKQG